MKTITDNIFILPAFFQKVSSSKERKHKSPIYYQILLMLEEEGDLPISQISSKLFMSRPNMTWSINKLVEDGVVKRVADAKDGRVVRVSITPQGNEFLKKSRVQLDKYIRMNLSPLNDQEIEELYNCLETTKKLLSKIQDI